MCERGHGDGTHPGSPGLAGGADPPSAPAGKGLGRSWEGAEKELAESTLASSIASGGGPDTPPPARPPRCPQVPGDESPARAPSSRLARWRTRGGTGADSAFAPAAAAAPFRFPPLHAALLRSAPTAAAAAMSADPVVFVSAARTAVGERRRRARRVADAPAGAGRVSGC